MKLCLKGYLSIIDKYGKIFISYINDFDELGNFDDTYDKLKKNLKDNDNIRLPYNNKEFWVIAGKKSNYCKELLGRQVYINVMASKYNFISKLEDNLGEEISGYKLSLIDIYTLKNI